MAKESTEISVATSPSTPHNNWWDLHNHHHANSLSPWTNISFCSPWQPQNPNSSNSSCEDDQVSMSTSFATYASDHSRLTAESSHRLVEPAAAVAAFPNELMGEHAPDNHQHWSHVFLSDGSNGELHNSGENLFNPLSSKSISTGIFDPAYDYLKKMDRNWEFTNTSSSSNNNFEKHLNGIGTETERLNKLSNLVSHWSIAPPDPEISGHFNGPQICEVSLSSAMADHHYNSNSSGRNSGILSYDGHDFGFNSTCSMMEADNKYYYGNGMLSHSQYSSARNFDDVITPSSRLSKPLIDPHVPKPDIKSLKLSECKKQRLKTSFTMHTRINGKEKATSNEGKKKRHEETSESVAKKPKAESSTASSSTKAPKVKLADKITTLQQIVSPFGKTDTASVLCETIGYIKFLQEQVQLLSNPYIKSNAHKDPWGSLDRKEKGDVKADLMSRGLCLVPISCTTKVYHENKGSDFWTPTYRGCLYR